MNQSKNILETAVQMKNEMRKIGDEARQLNIYTSCCQLINDINSRLDGFIEKMSNPKKVYELSGMEFKTIKIFAAKKLTELVNLLSDNYKSGKGGKRYVDLGLKVESFLNSLGYELFDLKVGEVFDVNLDLIFANLGKSEYNQNLYTNSTKELYITKSSLGCKEKDSFDPLKIIVKPTIQVQFDSKKSSRNCYFEKIFNN